MEENRFELSYKGNESSWEFVNGPWLTNDSGDLKSPADSDWSMDTHMALYTAKTFRNCRLSGKWSFNYAGGALLDLVVRSMDSRRFYAVKYNCMGNFPLPTCDYFISVSIWKGCPDGYRRMLAIRRKVGFFDIKHPYNWYDVSVEVVGNEIIAYFGQDFVCAARDDDYPVGAVGVDSIEGIGLWKDLAVTGRPVCMSPKWHDAETNTPEQFRIAWDPEAALKQHSETAAVLEDDEIVVGFKTEDKNKQLVTRSRDFGMTWDKPQPGHCGYYLKNRKQFWAIDMDHRPEVVFHDLGTNYDELNMDNFWFTFTRSHDRGKSWSEPQRADMPFPKGKAYAPIKGRAGSMLFMYTSKIQELSDGSVAATAFWRNSPDGSLSSDQVQFLKSFDEGRSWSMVPVDPAHWEGNESSFVELGGGEILCIIRSNYSNCCWESRSFDYGATWSAVRPVIAYFGVSFPSLMRAKNGVLLLAARGIGVFASADKGRTWKPPVYIRGYAGSGSGANMLQMSDGRILIISSTHLISPNGHCRMIGQFIRVDDDGQIHPATRG
jgi:hypothetical protein